MDEDEQRRLREYIEGNVRPPVLFKDALIDPVYLPSKEREIYVGYRGPISARRAYGVLRFMHSETHFHKELEAYAITDKVLQVYESFGTSYVLVAEEDTGTVYEFHISQFDDAVPEWAKGADEKAVNETQYYCKTEESWGKFEDHTPAVMIGDREQH